jgi:DNA-binding GntR family transcriptional regulator
MCQAAQSSLAPFAYSLWSSHVVFKTKVDHVYGELRDRILNGTLPPSAPLNQEKLAVDLGVSTTPLREAIRRLESEGLVSSRAHREAVVAPLDTSQVRLAYEVKQTLEPLAAHLAAERHAEADAELIRSTCAATLQPAPEEIAWEANRRFHRAVYTAARNPALTEFLDSLWDRYERFRRVFGVLVVDESVTREHVDIADAVIAGDASRASSLMALHVAHGGELIAQIDAGLQPQGV